MTVPHSDQRQSAAATADPIRALGNLTRALKELGVAARVVESPPDRPPFVRATNPQTPALSENVTCEPGQDGHLCFLYSWGEVIAPATDYDSAANSVRRVLGVV